MDGALHQLPTWLVLLAGLGNINDPSCLATPAYHRVSAGMPYRDAETLLGPAPHGIIGWYARFYFSGGYRSGTWGEGRWENQFGTMVVEYQNGEVTRKSFRPNAAGLAAFASYRQLRNGLLEKSAAPRSQFLPSLGGLFALP